MELSVPATPPIQSLVVPVTVYPISPEGVLEIVV